MPSGVSSSTVLTLLGFCASVLFIVFVCSRLVCALVRRGRRRPSLLPRFAVGASYSGPVPLVGRDQGIDLAAVAAFPTRAFSAGGPRGEPDESPLCVVCLAEYEEKDILRILPQCGHNFHLACIDIWLKQHSTCPVCRVSLRDYPGTGSKHSIPNVQSAVVVIPPNVQRAVVVIPPCSPEQPRSDPWHCLFVAAAGHSLTTAEVLRNEPGQANQVQISVDGGNNLTSSEVNSLGENNNQTVKLRMESPRVLGRP